MRPRPGCGGIRLLGVLVVACGAATAFADDGVTPEEAAALAARRAITTGDVEFTVLWPAIEDGVAREDRVRTMLRDHVVFDYRTHRKIFLERWPEQTGPRVIQNPDGTQATLQGDPDDLPERIIIDEEADRVYQYQPGVYDNGGRFAIITDTVAGDQDNAWRVVDPLLPGFVTTVYIGLHHRRLTSTVGTEQRSDVAVSDGELSGQPMRVVRFTDEHGNARECWFSPSQGGNVVRIAGSATRNGILQRWQTDSALQFFPDAGVWFPRRVEWRSWDDEKLQSVEYILVQVHMLNEPPAPEQFTIAALKALPGTGLSEHYPTEEMAREWDGHALVPRFSSQPLHPNDAPVDQPHLEERRRRLHFLAASLAAAGVAIGVVAVLRWRRRP